MFWVLEAFEVVLLRSLGLRVPCPEAVGAGIVFWVLVFEVLIRYFLRFHVLRYPCPELAGAGWVFWVMEALEAFDGVYDTLFFFSVVVLLCLVLAVLYSASLALDGIWLLGGARAGCIAVQKPRDGTAWC